MSSAQAQDAVIRRLEIVGEAVKNIPDDFKKSYPKVLWRKIAGMRDVLIHEYFAVDMELVWRAASKDAIELKKHIKKLL